MKNRTFVPDANSLADVREFLGQYFKGTGDHCDQHSMQTCLYTKTETENFILDTHPLHPNIVIGAGFSGHGFKFTPLVGKILADLALCGSTTECDLSPFRLPPAPASSL